MIVITVARKPLIGSVAQNVLKHGTGGLNIDGCRIGPKGGTTRSGQATYPKKPDGREDRSQCWARTGHDIVEISKGRWPANLILGHLLGCRCVGSLEMEDVWDCVSGCPVAALDAQSGSTGASAPVRGDEPSAASTGNVTGQRARVPGVFHADKGGASRFFKQVRGQPK